MRVHFPTRAACDGLFGAYVCRDTSRLLDFAPYVKWLHIVYLTGCFTLRNVLLSCGECCCRNTFKWVMVQLRRCTLCLRGAAEQQTGLVCYMFAVLGLATVVSQLGILPRTKQGNRV